jgi:molybdopterin synthase catalytic subunit
MRINVLLFASYADALGGPSIELELPDDATVADLVGRLRARPGAASLPARPLVAVDQVYARPEQRLAGSREIAIIPPVAGG